VKDRRVDDIPNGVKAATRPPKEWRGNIKIASKWVKVNDSARESRHVHWFLPRAI
jgi:hypothetical protein